VAINNHNRLFGIEGEDSACKYLSENGYTILNRNFRTKLGEIDLIAEKSEVIYFFEVKSRKNNNFGVPSEIINHTKLIRMEQIAWIYLQKVNRENTQWSIKIIEYIKNKCTIHDIIL
jgi:putative endonuclease